MAKQIAVNVGDGVSNTDGGEIKEVSLVQGDKYFFGNVSSASDDFDEIMSTNATYDQMVDLFYKAVGGKVEGVEISEVDCDGYTIQITNDAGVVDTLRVNVDMNELDQQSFGGNVGDNRDSFNVVSATDNTKSSKIIGTSKNYFDQTLGEKVGGIGDLVGGSAKGESDYQALLEAALDESDHRVTLLDIDGDSFTFQVHRNGAVDTFLVKDAAGIIANVFGADSLLDPKNSADQFVFVTEDDAPGKKIAIGTDAIAGPGEPDPLGGSLKVGDLKALVEQADQIAKVTVTEIGDLTQIAIAGNGGSTDIITIETDLLA
ncbi:MAG: hypothetical protein AAFN50_15785 [Pseudomonadota bacterium]